MFEGLARQMLQFGSADGVRDEPPESEPDLPALRPRLGLALGGGAARGWAHIGVVKALTEAGFRPDVVAGTSIGSVVGGCMLGGKLPELETFARSLTKRRMFALLDIHVGGSGLIAGARLKRLLNTHLGTITIEDLPAPFAAIATEIGSGHEVWLTHGLLVDAMRASYALPGVFDPVKLGRRWLMDGALVNPVPVSAARALGADIVLAVNLNGDNSGRGAVIYNHGAVEETIADAVLAEARGEGAASILSPMRSAASRMRRMFVRPRIGPGLATVMVDAFNITQDRISRSRLAGDPPDLIVAPRLAGVGLFDFHRAGDTIALGEEAARRIIPDLEALMAVPQTRHG